MALKAHVSFAIPEIPDAELKLISHFSSLGYSLTEQHTNKWIFHRGSKLGSLFRFDICAYSTVLTVCTNPSQQDQMRVSCDWDVWTCMSITTGADVSTLEAEARHLESVLRSQSVGEKGA